MLDRNKHCVRHCLDHCCRRQSGGDTWGRNRRIKSWACCGSHRFNIVTIDFATILVFAALAFEARAASVWRIALSGTACLGALVFHSAKAPRRNANFILFPTANKARAAILRTAFPFLPPAGYGLFAFWGAEHILCRYMRRQEGQRRESRCRYLHDYRSLLPLVC